MWKFLESLRSEPFNHYADRYETMIQKSFPFSTYKVLHDDASYVKENSIEVPLAGFDVSDIQIEYSSNGVLKVLAEKENVSKLNQFQIYEGTEIDEDNITYKNGLLVIPLKKIEDYKDTVKTLNIKKSE